MAPYLSNTAPPFRGTRLTACKGNCFHAAIVAQPADVRKWLPADCFIGCGVPGLALLTAGTSAMQLGYHWRPNSHFRCSAKAAEAAQVVMCACARYEIEAGRKLIPLLPLPRELWWRILGFVCRHDFG